jgi:UDP-N-acetyl-D-mannosaminuronic acid transferase (WecB/TagA/CpsF family)
MTTETITNRPSYAHPPLAILGVPFDNVTAAETISTIDDMVASRQPHYLVTANVDFLVQAQEDVELRRILFDAHLVLCDGTPLVWASRLLGNPLLERVAGADLVPLLLRVAAEKGYRVFFLGATPESVKQAVDNLKKLHPTLIIADYYSPPFNKLLEMESSSASWKRNRICSSFHSAARSRKNGSPCITARSASRFPPE